MRKGIARGRPWLLGRGGILVAGLAVLGAGPFFARPFILEIMLKDRVSRATSVTIVYLRDGFAWEQGKSKQDLASVTVISSPEVTEIVNSLRGPLLSGTSRGYDPSKDKCFEGFKEHRGFWPRVVFVTPDRKRVTIYLPYGDCGVWPDGLPWGWGGGWPLRYAAEKIIQQAHPDHHPAL